MKYEVVLTYSAAQDLKDLERAASRRILKKIEFFSCQEYPLQFSKPIADKRLGTYRFRVGDYRIIFDIDKKVPALIILRIKHRKDAYSL